MSEPVVIQQSPAWEEYPERSLTQEQSLHEITERNRLIFVDVLNNNSNNRMKNLGEKVVEGAKTAAETLADAKLSDREYAAWIMQSWSPGLQEATVERALAHRMSLLKTYSDKRPE